MEERPPWFRSRAYGYGWYPATAEGWFVVVLWLLILIGSTLVMLTALLRSHQPFTTILFILWGAVVLADTLTLQFVIYINREKRTERRRLLYKLITKRYGKNFKD